MKFIVAIALKRLLGVATLDVEREYFVASIQPNRGYLPILHN